MAAAADVVEAGARGVVGVGAAEKDGGGVDDGGDPGGVDGGLAQRLSQCAYGPPLWLSDKRPFADSALLHRQALMKKTKNQSKTAKNSQKNKKKQSKSLKSSQILNKRPIVGHCCNQKICIKYRKH